MVGKILSRRIQRYLTQYSQRYGPNYSTLCLKISVRMRGIKSSARMRMVTSRDPSRPIRSLKNVVEYKFVVVLILLLGMWFSLDPNETYSLNFTEKVNTMHSVLKAWQPRCLTLKGKITVFKSLLFLTFCTWHQSFLLVVPYLQN